MTVKNNSQIAIGIIGAGAIIPQSVQAMREQRSLFPVAICSRQESYESTKNLAKELQIPEAYPDVDEMLAKADVDAVYIAVANVAHFEVAKKTLAAGKHVLMEKPFCVNRRQASELFELAEKKNLIRMVQTNYSQYSSRYDRFLTGETPAVFDPAKAGGTLDSLNILDEARNQIGI